MKRFITVATAATILVVGAGGTGAVAGSLITSARIKNETIQSIDIKNGTIQLGDLSPTARASLRGQRGPVGPMGPAGPQGEPGTGAFTTTELIFGDDGSGVIDLQKNDYVRIKNFSFQNGTFTGCTAQPFVRNQSSGAEDDFPLNTVYQWTTGTLGQFGVVGFRIYCNKPVTDSNLGFEASSGTTPPPA